MEDGYRERDQRTPEMMHGEGPRFTGWRGSIIRSSLLYTPFERDSHNLKFIRILYVLHLYLLSYIVFALVLHLYLLEHGGGFIL